METTNKEALMNPEIVEAMRKGATVLVRAYVARALARAHDPRTPYTVTYGNIFDEDQSLIATIEDKHDHKFEVHIKPVSS